MKEELRQIYSALFNGRLAQKEALDRIRAIKVQEHSKGIGVLLLTSGWQASGSEVSAGTCSFDYAEHHVILCELSKISARKLGSLLPQAQCLTLDASEQKNIAQRYGEYALTCFERVRTILRDRPTGKVLVQIVVAGYEEQALFAGLSGLLKTASLENPRFVGQVILVPKITSEELGWRLHREKAGGSDPLIRYEQGVRQVFSWKELPTDPRPPSVAFREEGVYLITGGLGALGFLFTKEILARTRHARIVLTGRSASNAEKQALLAGLFAQPDRVSYRPLDLGNLDQVQQLIAAIKEEYGQLNGILHLAGMIADNFILKKSNSEFGRVLAPKVEGTYNLDQASQDVELDFFTMFSSVAGAIGNVGQADYATANGFMDGFAAYRNGLVTAKQRHGRTRAINWPLWQAGGIRLDAARQELLEQATGVRPMQTAAGIEAFYRSLALPNDQILVLEGDLPQIRRVLLARWTSQPQLAPLLAAEERSLGSEAAATRMDSEARAEKTQDYLRRQCSELLKLPAHNIDPQAALETYGIDSILAVKLTNQLEKTFGPLAKTLFFEYQTIHELSKYFTRSHAGRLATLFATNTDGNSDVQAKGVEPRMEARFHAKAKLNSSKRFSQRTGVPANPTTESDPIAIIGLSGRYPEAANIEAYWHNLREGKDCIMEVPKERWDWREYFSEDRTKSGHHYSKWGGFIAGVDEFDPLFFNISPKEAKYIDPQERLFLQHAWMAVEDAGYTRTSLRVPCTEDLGGQVGVYAGLMYSEYQLFGAEASVQGKRLGIAGSFASIANRVSYTLNLHGPSMTLDSMCSSSLTAIHVACQDLKLGRTSMAIAGGVNVSIHPNKYLVLSAGQFISSDGHCQSFGEGGDGYIAGEGVGVVVLKRLSEAKRDGDHIYGIIRGSALNHGGKTNGYTVPNPQAQASVIRRALAESKTDARHISYIEAHGTGTKLGDPIEIAALSQAFQHDTQDTEFCRIGSVKSNIGHCESASGIAGLTKVLLQMQHQQIVPSLHSEQLNPHIDFAQSPFVVNQALGPWEPPVIDGQKLPRIAGISSFGAGGSNAHMIVEEYEAPVQPQVALEKVALEKVVILLSARTGEQLRQKGRDLLEFIQEEAEGAVRGLGKSIDVESLAYTLQVGREAMQERVGMVVSSVEELRGKLQAYIGGEQGIEDFYAGQVKRDQESLSLFSSDADLQQTVEKWIGKGKYSKLLELWVKGLEVDWSKLYGETRPQRISLPTYPFARERYWIDIARKMGAQVAGSGVVVPVLHPLLHSNTSDLSQHSYSATFNGEESFLKEHPVDGGRMLLPAVYLEMARAAVERAAPGTAGALLELRDVVWGEAAMVAGKKQVNIALWMTVQDQIDYEIYSQGSHEEIVHCQGHVVWSGQTASSNLDLAQLKASGETLARLQLPKGAENTLGEYVLHPSLLEGALQAAVGLLDSEQARLPLGLEMLRIVRPCTSELYAWVRYAPGSQPRDGTVKLDIDLCDEQGSIRAQMRGLSWLETGERVVQEAALPASKEVPRVVRARKEIELSARQQTASSPVEQKKPTRITLGVPSAVAMLAKAPSESLSAGRAPVTLSGTLVRWPRAGRTVVDPAVRLFDCGGGIFSIEVDGESLTQERIAGLLAALERVQEEAAIKVLLLRGIAGGWWRGGREEYNQAIGQGLYAALVSFPYPVIAVLADDAIGAGFLLAALCDFMVLNEEAAYGYTDAQKGVYPTVAEAVLFGERFGEVLAQDFLYVSKTARGKQLRERGWTCPIVPAGEVEAVAEELAAELAGKSQVALGSLKPHLMRHLAGWARELKVVETAATKGDRPDRAGAERRFLDAPIQAESTADGVLLIQLGSEAGSQELVAELRRAAAKVAESASYRAIVLASTGGDFLGGMEAGLAEEALGQFEQLILEAEIPVVGALAGNARGAGLLLSQYCDVCVYNARGMYSATGLGPSPLLTQRAAALFAQRWGNSVGRLILLSGAEYSGAELQQWVGPLLVAETAQVLATALRVAESWAELPRATLAAWKKHSASRLVEKMRKLGSLSSSEMKGETAELPVAVPMAIALESKVVTATAHPEGIVVVKMEDREAKNMFSEKLIAGVIEVFRHIEETPGYKVVVLTGYENYFACGGTKENLLAIQAGKARFTDSKIFEAALECSLPVIAAMQGHGIGAGLCLGMLADVVLLSEESRYVSPYMNYGFTPGAGATYILAKRLGQDLARESLLTGRGYGGRELHGRGVKLGTRPRAEVNEAALALARQMAQASSRSRLLGLKRQWREEVQPQLDETYSWELAMHEKTFVGRADTRAEIEKSFYPVMEALPVGAQPAPMESLSPPAEGDVLAGITASLKTLLANELQLAESEIDEQVQFVDLGLDSITGVSWVRKINERYQTKIEATKVYSHPTLSQLSRYVKEEAEKRGTPSSQVGILSAARPAPSEKSTSSEGPQPKIAKLAKEKLKSWRNRGVLRLSSAPPASSGQPAGCSPQPIAVIGMAGQFPQARNLDEFWQNLAQGRSCISSVPADRWDVKTYYQAGKAVPGKSNSQWMGALEDYDRFDPLFFNISPTEAESMDPQQRLFLEACWHSIEDAGYDARVLSGSKCGVFVGCTGGQYQQLSRPHQLSAHDFTGNATSILAARISYFLNLQGPCVAIDTACSSSLVAIAHACDSLTWGSSDLVLAGGVCVMAGPELHIMTSQAGMLSPEGICFTFDQRADGFVPGEGVGVVLLKRLAEAERDRDMIYGVIEGWGVNQDGKTNGITAPNPESQTRLEQEVYEKYGIDPANIQLIEAHGTGTKLGDPIEVEGLKKAFQKYTQKREYCALGSVKSNIGHCATAAGIAGLIKLVLALQHKQLPPTINFERLNEHIDLQGSPFYVNRELQEWEVRGAERRQAAVSSFGFSGTNAHLVIGQYLPPAEVQPPVRVVTQNTKVIPLSARKTEQLKQKAGDLLAFIRKEAQSIDLMEMAYTLQVGRETMEERIGFVVSSVEQLAKQLQAYIEGQPEIKDFYQGQGKRSKESISILSQDDEIRATIMDKLIAGKKLSRLLELWVKGVDLDWNKLYGEIKPRRMRLPAYPFAKERYWIETAENGQVTGSASASHVLSQEINATATQDQAIGVLLARPLWQASSIEAFTGASAVVFTEHHVIVCELLQVNVENLEYLLPHSRCLSLQAGKEKNIAQRYNEYALMCFDAIQTILRGQPKGRVLVQLLIANHHQQALLAGLSGLLKTAGLENPQLTGQLLLVEPDTTTEELAEKLQAEKSGGTERLLQDPLIRYAGDVREILRWEEITVEPQEFPIPFKDDGVYLITGGLGGLGLLFAEQILLQTHAARVVLTGRSTLSQEKRARLDGLPAQPGRVNYRQVDLGDLTQVERLIAAIKDEHGQLNGILHSAGILADNVILKKTSVEFSAVLAPKVTGTYNLDQASQAVELDFFVLFSSVAGAMGNPHTADYAAANAFMDQFAAYRNRQVAAGQRHGQTRSINWPVWQDGGMRIDQASRERLQQTTGMLPMQTSTGLEALYRSLVLPYDQVLVVEGIKDKIVSYYLQKTNILNRPSTPEAVGPAQYAHKAKDSYSDMLAETKVSLDQLPPRLKIILATVLRIEPSLIDVDQAFVELGLDSFLGTELVIAINKEYGTELSNISVFDYPTVRELALFLEREITKLARYAEKLPAVPAGSSQLPMATSHVSLKREISSSRPIANSHTSSDDKIAIIGMSGRYPQANNLQEFWENLVQGRNSIVEVPRSRWDVSRYYDPDPTKKDRTNSRWLGALNDIDCFDPLFFRISPQEADYIDPHHRLFLQESYKAFEDAGYSASTLSNNRCGIYLGISSIEYALLLAKNGLIAGAPVTSNHPAIAAARIAYYLNLKGPAISIDTACSSSLVAIHLACQGLLSRETDMALAGGVTLWLTPEPFLSMTQAGMLSPVGQCKAFDDTADGIVVGEGVGAVVLKRLRDAQDDKDFIYGVILGSGINQDGKTNGITAPSVNSQIELERAIYARHGIDPETIGYVETHGTGTKLGDPIELEALATVFREKTTRKNYCGLGSVKSNTGHTTSAAGVAGVQKVLLSLQHRILVPSLNVTRETSSFDLKNSPFYVVREEQPWVAVPGSPRRAAVSSFGFSGTNAHLVIEEYLAPAEQVVSTRENGDFIVPLSARTTEQLQQKARDLLEFVRASQQCRHSAGEPPASPKLLDLAAVAYTLEVGRDAMEERIGFIVNSLDKLADKLNAYLNGEKNIENATQGRVESGDGGMAIIGRDDDMREAVDKWIARKKLSKLLELWIRGLNFDWNKLYDNVKPRRVSLPTYPFAKEHYWIDAIPTREGWDGTFEVNGTMKSIENILNKIDDDMTETGQVVKELKMLV